MAILRAKYMIKKLGKWLRKNWLEIVIDGAIAVFVLGLISVGGILLWISSLDIPDLSSFEERRVLQSTKIYDKTGEILLYLSLIHI